MPSVAAVCRTDAGLASELRWSVTLLRRRLTAERHPDNPLSLSSMAVLGQLMRHGELSVGELARAEHVQPPSMTRLVRTLGDEGYVTRRSDADDGRIVMVSLTDSGRDIVLASRRRRDAWLAQRLTELTAAERETLRAAAPILDRLAQAT